jgi:hypothetical protein
MKERLKQRLLHRMGTLKRCGNSSSDVSLAEQATPPCYRSTVADHEFPAAPRILCMTDDLETAWLAYANAVLKR